MAYSLRLAVKNYFSDKEKKWKTTNFYNGNDLFDLNNLVNMMIQRKIKEKHPKETASIETEKKTVNESKFEDEIPFGVF